MGDAHVTNLFYADDIVLVITSRLDMEKALSTLSRALHTRGLQINCSKSKILKMGPGTTMSRPWPLLDPHGRQIRVLHEFDEFKYHGCGRGSGKGLPATSTANP